MQAIKGGGGGSRRRPPPPRRHRVPTPANSRPKPRKAVYAHPERTEYFKPPYKKRRSNNGGNRSNRPAKRQIQPRQRARQPQKRVAPQAPKEVIPPIPTHLKSTWGEGLNWKENYKEIMKAPYGTKGTSRGVRLGGPKPGGNTPVTTLPIPPNLPPKPRTPGGGSGAAPRVPGVPGGDTPITTLPIPRNLPAKNPRVAPVAQKRIAGTGTATPTNRKRTRVGPGYNLSLTPEQLRNTAIRKLG